jgi:hypothetical protein
MVRIRPGQSKKSGGKIVYIGRTGKHTKGENSAISARVATFITACMGFGTFHAGGDHFFEQSVNGGKQSPVHTLSARDLEVSYVLDSDPVCRENEELQKLPRLPAFNKGKPHFCGRPNCKLAKKLSASLAKWWEKASR